MPSSWPMVMTPRAARRRRRCPRPCRSSAGIGDGAGHSTGRRLFFFQLPALDGDKAGAKPADAGIVQVAGALIDAARLWPNSVSPAPPRQLDIPQSPQPSHTARWMTTVLVGAASDAALPAPALFGGAGLVVDDGRAPLTMSHAARAGWVELIAVVVEQLLVMPRGVPARRRGTSRAGR